MIFFLALFVLVGLATFVLNAIPLLRWARAPGEENARRRRHQLAFVAAVLYLVFLFFLGTAVAAIAL